MQRRANLVRLFSTIVALIVLAPAASAQGRRMEGDLLVTPVRCR